MSRGEKKNLPKKRKAEDAPEEDQPLEKKPKTHETKDKKDEPQEEPSSEEASGSEESEYEDHEGYHGLEIVLKIGEEDVRVINTEIEEESSITPETPENIKGLCSSGFSSCFAIVTKAKDNSFIFLEHLANSLEADKNLPGDLADLEKFSQKKPGELEVTIGFSRKLFTEGLIRAQGIKRSSTQQQQFTEENLLTPTPGITKGWEESYEGYYNKAFRVLNALSSRFKIINLPKGTIVVNRKGEIFTDVEQDEIEKAAKKAKKLQEQGEQDSKESGGGGAPGPQPGDSKAEKINRQNPKTH
jgi:hypothetical protein